MGDEQAAQEAGQAAACSEDLHRPRTMVKVVEEKAEPKRWITGPL